MEDKLFTVIIPAYNAVDFIERAVKSVESQTSDSWELIIVENGSTDNTFDVCSSLSDGNRIRVLQSEKGVSNARNKGIENAYGTWLIFLDADDELIPDALETVKNEIALSPDIISGRYEHNKITGNRLEFLGEGQWKKYLNFCFMDPTQKCNATGVAFRKEFIIENNIRFNTELSYSEDSEFLVKVISHKAKAIDIDKHLYRVITNNDSATRSMDISAIEKYEKSIGAIKNNIDLNDVEISNAFQVFVLSQLLIFLTNGIYKNEPFSKANKAAEELCNRNMFKDAVEKVELHNIPKSRKIVFWLMKKNSYRCLGAIIKGRIFVKNLRK